MATYFDEAKVRRYASRDDWYIRLGREYKRVLKKHDQADRETKDAITTEIYDLAELLLGNGELKVADSGPIDFDANRKQIDTLIVHHTSQPSGMTKGRLNAIHLLRLYASYFANPAKHERSIRKKAIYSGHVRGGQQKFWAYHWLIKSDGKAERLLADDETGWHAGNWDVNCRSIGVCLDGDFTNSSPSDNMLRTVQKLIDDYKIKSSHVLGHCEVNKTTICPGNEFYTWKVRLLEGVNENHRR